MEQIIHATDTNFEGQEAMRQFILNRTPFFGNDDEYADRIAIQIFNDLYDAIEGKPNTKGECFHLNMLSTTCHVYFGKMMNATPTAVWPDVPSVTVPHPHTEQIPTGHPPL